MTTPKLTTFKPKFPWVGGDLQTVRNNVLRRRGDLSTWPARTEYVDLDDGTGDKMAFTFNEQIDRSDVAQKPLICLIHGLSGCEDSFAITLSASYFLRKGFDTCRINLRGAGPYHHIASRSYHAGKSEDLRPVLEQLAKTYQLFLIGHSLGGNLLIKGMAEYGNQYNIVGAGSLCAPVHMARTEAKFSRTRNKLYQYYILRGMKRSWLGFKNISDELRAHIKRIRTVYQFDDELLAPSIGLPGADQYYTENSSISFFDEVKAKTLICAAKDDPWIPIEPYLEYDWSRNDNLISGLTKTGGHCGFHQSGHKSTWFDRACHDLINRLTT